MKAKVTLINWTPKPIETMAFVRRVMHASVPDSLEELEKNPQKWLGMSIEEYVERILKQDGMPTFLEYVHFTFKIENVSRALTHQLVRHRVGTSYSQQSLRCVQLPSFADDEHFHMPSSVKDPVKYAQAMKEIQKIYNGLLEFGENTENSRGVLPMNIGTTIVVGVTLRALIGIVNKRLCLKTQEEFQKVAYMLMEEIGKVDKRLLKWFGKPCDFGGCMMKAENEQQLAENKRTGKQQTEYVCPVYIEKFVKNRREEK